MIELSDKEVEELRAFVKDVNDNPFASSEIHAMGGVRTVLSDELLVKLGFLIEGPPPPLAFLNRRGPTSDGLR